MSGRAGRWVVVLIAVAVSCVAARANDSITSKIKLTPTGRLLVDGAVYFSDDKEFAAGAAIPEARLGLQGAYENFTAKVEVGVSYGKLVLKDIYIQARLGERWHVRAGNFIHPFGLQSAYNSSMKTSMEMPTSNAVFDLPRSIGVKGKYYDNDWMAAMSIGVESKASVLSSTAMGKTGLGVDGRFVWRRAVEGSVVQIGWSGAWLAPQYNEDEELNHRSISLSANFPTSVARVKALSAIVDDASGYFKFTPELLLCHGRVALESQYYYGQVWRKDNAPAYKAYGAYALLRGIVRGGDYRYRSIDARLDAPAPKSIEVALQYNYTCLSDSHAGIRGGRISDVSCTLNWYINRYIIWRLRGGYSHNWDRADMSPIDVGCLQTRLQIIF